MSRIAEILTSGRAPGVPRGTIDPTWADSAVPRALRDVEIQKGTAAMVQEMGWKPTKRNVEAIRKTWKIA